MKIHRTCLTRARTLTHCAQRLTTPRKRGKSYVQTMLPHKKKGTCVFFFFFSQLKEKLKLLIDEIKERVEIQYQDITSFIELASPEENPEDLSNFVNQLKQHSKTFR